MSSPELLRLAFSRLRRARARAALTMLGVIIGVAAVIAMLALGRGARAAVDEQLARLGSDVLTVIINGRIVMRNRRLLTLDETSVKSDARALRDKIIKSLAPATPSQ